MGKTLLRLGCTSSHRDQLIAGVWKPAFLCLTFRRDLAAILLVSAQQFQPVVNEQTSRVCWAVIWAAAASCCRDSIIPVHLKADRKF